LAPSRFGDAALSTAYQRRPHRRVTGDVCIRRAGRQTR